MLHKYLAHATLEGNVDTGYDLELYAAQGHETNSRFRAVHSPRA